MDLLAPFYCMGIGDWLSSEGLYSKQSTKGPQLGESELQRFREYLAEVTDKDARTLVLRVEQQVGDIVSIPPGWLHQVVTFKPCLKVAWDYVKSFEMMPRLASVHNVLHGFNNPFSAPDYMGLSQIRHGRLQKSPLIIGNHICPLLCSSRLY